MRRFLSTGPLLLMALSLVACGRGQGASWVAPTPPSIAGHRVTYPPCPTGSVLSLDGQQLTQDDTGYYLHVTGDSHQFTIWADHNPSPLATPTASGILPAAIAGAMTQCNRRTTEPITST